MINQWKNNSIFSPFQKGAYTNESLVIHYPQTPVLFSYKILLIELIIVIILIFFISYIYNGFQK
jgi:hypothetical protein